MQQLNIIRGDFYPYLEDSCNIRIIDKTTGQITTEDFSDCYAVLQIQKLQKTYTSDVLNTKILPLSLSREETSSLRKCIEDTAYLAIYKDVDITNNSTDTDIQLTAGQIDTQIYTPGAGSNDYNELINRPKINGIELIGDKTPEELDIMPLTNAEIDEFMNS